MIASRFHASRTSRIIQLLVVLGLLMAATQLVLSRENGPKAGLRNPKQSAQTGWFR